MSNASRPSCSAAGCTPVTGSHRARTSCTRWVVRPSTDPSGCSPPVRSAVPRSPTTIRHLVDEVHARGHELFSGRLDKSVLGFAERAIVAAVRAPDGDFRNWEAIDAWAGDIAEQLVKAPA